MQLVLDRNVHVFTVPKLAKYKGYGKNIRIVSTNNKAMHICALMIYHQNTTKLN